MYCERMFVPAQKGIKLYVEILVSKILSSICNVLLDSLTALLLIILIKLNCL